MPIDQTVPNLLAIGFFVSAVAANALILVYGALRVRPLPRELLQLWVYKNMPALTRTYLSLSLGSAAGLIGLILHQSLATPADDQVVVVGAVICAALSIYGARHAMRILRTGVARLHLGRP